MRNPMHPHKMRKPSIKKRIDRRPMPGGPDPIAACRPDARSGCGNTFSRGYQGFPVMRTERLYPSLYQREVEAGFLLNPPPRLDPRFYPPIDPGFDRPIDPGFAPPIDPGFDRPIDPRFDPRLAPCIDPREPIHCGCGQCDRCRPCGQGGWLTILQPLQCALYNVDTLPIAQGIGPANSYIQACINQHCTTVHVEDDGRWSFAMDAAALKPGRNLFTVRMADDPRGVTKEAVWFELTPAPLPAPVITSPVEGAILNRPVIIRGTAQPGALVKIEGLPGEFVARVGANGEWAIDVSAIPNGGYSIWAVALDECGCPGAPSTAVNFAIEATYALSIRVLYSDMTPAAGISVIARQLDGNAYVVTTTDPNGWVLLDELPFGEYIIKASDAIGDEQVAIFATVNGTPATVQLVLPAPTGLAKSQDWIYGRVTDAATGLPIAQAMVYSGNASASTSADGYYVLLMTPEQPADVVVGATGYQSAQKKNVPPSIYGTIVNFALTHA